MKLNEKALANTLACLGLASFIGCVLLTIVAPGIYQAIMQSWFHGVDLSLIWNPRPGNIVLGLISFTLISWLSGWAFAWLYNKFTKS